MLAGYPQYYSISNRSCARYDKWKGQFQGRLVLNRRTDRLIRLQQLGKTLPWTSAMIQTVPKMPPFTPEAELVHWKISTPPTIESFFAENLFADSLPCTFIERGAEEILLVSRHIRVFLKEDLSFHRLDVAYKYLWWAGRQSPARPLHRQIHELSREIALTRRADLHLVWCPRTKRIFLKPLPRYLLSHAFWTSYMSTDRNLDAGARGFLLSYIWLIRDEYDWALAHDARLIPAEVTWRAWHGFVESLIRSGGLSVNGLVGIHRRFHYGELRVNRLDHIYRFMCPCSGPQLLRGYGALLPASYSDFFRRRFRWIIMVFGFCTTALSALQVGRATDLLSSSKALQEVSSGIVLFCLAALGIIVVMVSVLYIALFVTFLGGTIVDTLAIKRKRGRWTERRHDNCV